MGRVAALYRYPLQGCGGQPLTHANITAWDGFPFDRIIGLVEEIKRKTIDGEQVIHKLRGDIMLLHLNSHYDPATKELSLYNGPTCLVTARLPDEDDIIANQLARLLGYEHHHTLTCGYKMGCDLLPATSKQQKPLIKGAYKKTAISIINRASVAALSTAMGVAIDETRFRANIYIDNLPPFAEWHWLGKTMPLGPLLIQPIERTTRCNIVEINPKSGTRDLDLLNQLLYHYQHKDMGIYAEVIKGGSLTIGDTLG